jgi:hypothetical protein
MGVFHVSSVIHLIFLLDPPASLLNDLLRRSRDFGLFLFDRSLSFARLRRTGDTDRLRLLLRPIFYEAKRLDDIVINYSTSYTLIRWRYTLPICFTHISLQKGICSILFQSFKNQIGLSEVNFENFGFGLSDCCFLEISPKTIVKFE